MNDARYVLIVSAAKRSICVVETKPLTGSTEPELYAALAACVEQIMALCSADDVPDGAEAALSRARGQSK